MALGRRWVLALALLVAGCGRGGDDKPAPPAPPLRERNAATVYRDACANCHDGPHAVEPTRENFKRLQPETVIRAMNGIMAVQAHDLTPEQRTQVARYITGRMLGDPPAPSPLMCAEWQNRMDMFHPPGAASRLTPDLLPRLAVKWAFAFPGASRAGNPAVAGGAVFVAGEDGVVQAIDEAGGCVRWRFQADAEVRGTVVVGPWMPGDLAAAPAVFFGDDAGSAYRVDAATGQLVWKARADSHGNATIAGTPVLHEGRLYVPVASTEWVAAADPDHECCTFRGGVTALDAATGKPVWQSWAIAAEPRLTGDTNAAGTPTWQPAGAPVWAGPAVDAKRKRLYMATGAAYTSPAPAGSDSVIAVDLLTGRKVWRYQAAAGDAWTMSCRMADKTNCPVPHGSGADFTAPPLLVALPGGRDLLLARQKTGDIHALDPQTGKLAWRRTLSQGAMGWTPAPDGSVLYVADATGLHALDAVTGSQLWAAPGRLSAPPVLVPGAVLTGSHDGMLHAHDPLTGMELWSFDTTAEVAAVDGAKAHGGAIDAAPIAVDGRIFVASGSHRRGLPGNVLLMLEPSWARPAQGTAPPPDEAPSP